MSTTAPEVHADSHVKHHPKDSDYVKVAVILAVITGLEVSTYFWKSATTTQLVILLFPMMILKFAIVCAYFMHLKYDNKIFRRVFVFGLVLATIVYMIVFFAFDFFQDDYLRFLRR
jgi:cytochrome c oxidase subunit 4